MRTTTLNGVVVIVLKMSALNEKKFKNKYRVASARYKYWDYGWGGLYFITICTKYRKLYFGDIIKGKMRYSTIGQIAKNELLKTESIRLNVKLDQWIIMPNHIHVIIVIENDISIPSNAMVITPLSGATPLSGVETQCIASLRWRGRNKFGPQKNNLASIIRGFKMSVKTLCNKNHIDFAWQPRFYDHIIRDEKSLMNIRRYIANNPIKWEFDRNNREKLFM